MAMDTNHMTWSQQVYQDGSPSEQGSSQGNQMHSTGQRHTFDLFTTAQPPKPERQTLTKDGQPAKRRGPKPDSKPALTKRQQMNRQAQRSHRERKELYIKNLEEDVLRFKEIYTQIVQEKESTSEENRRLKVLLQKHGIPFDSAISMSPSTSGVGPSSSGSFSGSYAASSDRSGYSPETSLPPSSYGQGTPQSQPRRNMAQLPNTGLDYDQIGIDFILKLETSCKDHIQYLLTRSHNPENQPHHHPAENPDDADHVHMSGHALMATSVPLSHIMEMPAEHYPHQPPSGMANKDLVRLLNLSARLPMNRDGEITPVMAWSWIFQHSRVGELNAVDFANITADLASKVRCYGFGAVLEEFEVEDAMNAVLAPKDFPQLEAGFARQMISV